jgi:hypothetical protein
MATTHPRHAAGTGTIRATAVGGVLFFLFILGYAQLTTGSPSATDPGREVLVYLSDHQGDLQLAAVCIGFAMPAALVALGGLVRALRHADAPAARIAADVALAGGALAAAATVAGSVVLGAIATSAGDLTPGAAAVWWTLHLLGFGGTLLGLLLLVGATAVVSLQSDLFPRWFAFASAALAALSVVGAATVGYDAAGIQIVAGLAVLLDSVWILVVSLYLWRDPTRALAQ